MGELRGCFPGCCHTFITKLPLCFDDDNDNGNDDNGNGNGSDSDSNRDSDNDNDNDNSFMFHFLLYLDQSEDTAMLGCVFSHLTGQILTSFSWLSHQLQCSSSSIRNVQNVSVIISWLEILAGQQTISKQDGNWSGQTFCLPVILIGKKWYLNLTWVNT